MGTHRRALTWLFIGLVGAAGCSQDPTTSEPYQQVAAELDARSSELAQVQARVDELTTQLEQARDEVTAADSERDQARHERDVAQQVADDLRVRYDDQIRADLQAAYDAEVQRACTEASDNPQHTIASVTRFDQAWEVLGLDAEQLDSAVEACAAPAREAASLTQQEAEQALAGLVGPAIAVVKGETDEIDPVVEEAAAAAADLIRTAIFVDPDAEWVNALSELADRECSSFSGCAAYEAVDLLETYRLLGVPGAPAVMHGGDRTVGTGPDEASPGTWVAYDVSGCYWERLDAAGEIIDNNFVNGAPQVQVTIRSSDFAFNSSDCSPWLRF